MLNAESVLHSWLVNAHDVLDPPARVIAAKEQIARQENAQGGHWLNWQPQALEDLLQLVDQQRLEFSAEESHANVRTAVARYLDHVVMPQCADLAIRKLPGRLREARQSGLVMWNPSDQRFVTLWDTKAGLPLLCPDDAREEAMRLQRRYVPTLTGWRNNGKALHYAVFTMPNFEPGKLRQGMQAIFKRFRALLKSGKFPEIVGALCTLEAPLGRCRDWNVHLNVVLMCDGFLDYKKLREQWHWDVEIQRLRGDQEAIEATLRELVKYPVQAMPSKSASKADRERAAPAMTEWTAQEWVEWWNAHKGFRRTRTYGELFGIEKPEAESLDGFIALGQVKHDGQAFRFRSALLDSIPGDKSSGVGYLDRLRRHLRGLSGPPDEALAMLEAAAEVEKRWQQAPKPTH